MSFSEMIIDLGFQYGTPHNKLLTFHVIGNLHQNKSFLDKTIAKCKFREIIMTL